MKVADIKVDYIGHCGSDMSVVNAARVSFDKESEWDYEEVSGEDEHGFYTEDIRKLKPQDVKLINYLAKHKHKSPFNHAFITVRVKAPVFVARQLVKHKFMPWNEVSRRYVDCEPEFYSPDVWRSKAENVKQGSSQDPVDNELGVMAGFNDLTDRCVSHYNWMLEQGVCAEQARMVLPQSVMTEWIWSGTLGAFADMLVLRLSSYTQAETRVVAEQIKAIVEAHFPVSLAALIEHS